VTVQTRPCPCSIWASSTTPGTPAVPDTDAIELGVKFKSDVNGYITGIRFYKGTGNTGTHVGNLWTSTGTLLQAATFTGESATGWQQVNFASPVAITANTIYVASYHTNTGHWAQDGSYFSNRGVDAAPLHVPSDAAAIGNGVFAYGPTTFPTDSFSASNYWVDVVFSKTGPPPGPPVIMGVQATGITSSGATIQWNTDRLADSQVEFGTSTAYGSSTTLDPNLVASHAQTLSGLAASTLYHYRVKSKDASGSLSVSGDFTFTTTTPGPVTVTFDDLTPNQPLNGQYPSGVINWGTNFWFVSGPYAQFTTNSISFWDGAATSANFTFVAPTGLISLQASNGGTVASTISLSCAGNPTKTQLVDVNQLITISTGWLNPCSVVTIASSNGWDTNFKNLVYNAR
jgi:hypothetical protein